MLAQCGGEPAQLVFVDGAASCPFRLAHLHEHANAERAGLGACDVVVRQVDLCERALDFGPRIVGPAAFEQHLRAQHVGDALQHRAVGVAGELVAGDDVRVGGVELAASERDLGAEPERAEHAAADAPPLHPLEQLTRLGVAPEIHEGFGAVLPDPVESHTADPLARAPHAGESGGLLEPVEAHQHMAEVAVGATEVVGVTEVLGDRDRCPSELDAALDVAQARVADAEGREGMGLEIARTGRAASSSARSPYCRASS